MTFLFRNVLLAGALLTANISAAEADHAYHLPQPTGPFAVGRTVVWWTDQSRRERTVANAAYREIRAFVYYPADRSGVPAEYYPGLSGLGSIPETKILAQHFGVAWPAVIAGSVRSNSFSNVPFSAKVNQCPTLVFSPGGSAPVLAYSAQLEELASYGYVVVGLEHANDTALIIRSDRTLIPFVDPEPSRPGPPSIAGLKADLEEVIRWSEDSKFALDQLAIMSRESRSILFRRLDLARIGIFGHSLGGKAAARLCQTDSRLKACLNEDGELFGIPFDNTQPISSLDAYRPMAAPFVDIYVAEQLATDSQLSAAHISRKQVDDWRGLKSEALKTFLGRNTERSYFVEIRQPGFKHGSFMDIPGLGAVTAGTDTTSAESRLRTANRLTRSFFDAFLQHHDKDWNELLTDPPTDITVKSWVGKQGR